MMPFEDTCTSFRFSTDGLPEAARAKAVRELYEHTSLPGKIEPLEPLPDCSVRADITKRKLPGLGVMSGTLRGLRQAARPRGSVSSDEDDLLLAVNVSGHSTAQQCDRELTLRDGDAVLATRGSNGFTITRPTPVRFMGFRVPRDAIAPLVGRLDDAPIRAVPRGTEALNLLVTYTGAIADDMPLRALEVQRLVVTHIHDLIAVTLGATRDGWAIAEGRGIRAARLRAIVADITANLGDSGLTVAAIAQRQRVTPRYVHKLFEGEGLAFSAFVLRRRLAYAYRMLSDPRLGHRSISSVAFEVGFGDLSYFNRAFRRCYGATPSEIRQSAERSGSPR
ncbi:MAG TPA: AraC family transcriptional regulator [Bradyrhizobium sp.]|uniref:helix-turn-helix transcriptional regulator n=1 Tax=Bradyrhizobium sp. TaxID=376 RepID=UPI002B9599B6|nr:AraC family transcriptional regulator [Bradyrhizobium sp.]HLZ03876.1 AraC family transcriptional regulator [Bradyrhizobium sp.]